MKIGVFTALFADQPLEEVLDYLSTVGFETVELYAGALAPPTHCDPGRLLENSAALKQLQDSLSQHSLEISALNASGNPVHPDEAIARIHHKAFEDAVRLAESLGVNRVIVFSGCPGGGPEDRTPNWVTCPWPEEFAVALAYQWDEVLAPYWQKASAFAAKHGVTQLAFEMHPGFCVYNPDTLLRLRTAVGSSIGANFDPSHLFWQGIQPRRAILELGDAIFHVHAKDTRMFSERVAVNGVLDNRHYSRASERPWVFGTVGYGHPEADWRGIIDALAITGFDGVVSIEHEDLLMGKKEGLEKAFHFLNRLIIRERPEVMWWA